MLDGIEIPDTFQYFSFLFFEIFQYLSEFQQKSTIIRVTVDNIDNKYIKMK